MKSSSSFILLTSETMWKKPIQATSFGKNQEGKIYSRRFFAQWETFEEAEEILKRSHNCEIKIDRQCKLTLLVKLEDK